METVLLIGEGDLAEETRQALDAAGAEVYRLKTPEEREVVHALDGDGIDRVVVVSRDDAVALRTALMIRNVDGDVPMMVTIFDPTMAARVDAELEHCEVTSMADIVAPSLAGPCLADDLIAVREDRDPPVGVRETPDGVDEVPIEVPKRKRAAALARNLLMPYDKSAALLLWGALGLVVILVLETIACMAVLGQGVIDASYGSAKTLVTVDPNDEVADGPGALKTFLTVSMLAALVFEASFTAGLVNRLIDRRLTGLPPPAHHLCRMPVGCAVRAARCASHRRVTPRGARTRVRGSRAAGGVGRGATVAAAAAVVHRAALPRSPTHLENITIAMAAQRSRRPARRAAHYNPHHPPRGSSAAEPCRGAAMSWWSAWVRWGCGCACCCAAAGSASSRSTSARRARTSASRASSGSRS